jgi:hypothetical protein
LSRQHEVEIVVRFDVEDSQDLVQQFSVLRGGAGANVKIRALTEMKNYGAEFDGFRARAEDDQDFLHGFRYFLMPMAMIEVGGQGR